ncbi:MAG: hypothetical protein ACFB21_13940 [Opitutales bacterium]
MPDSDDAPPAERPGDLKGDPGDTREPPSAEGRDGRFGLLKAQFVMATLLLILVAISLGFENKLSVESEVRVVFAPFLSLVPLIFLLVVMRDTRFLFKPGPYARGEVVCALGLAAGTTVLFALVAYVFDQVASLEVLIALISAVVAAVALAANKVKNLLGMAALTGVGEGLTVYMVFFF